VAYGVLEWAVTTRWDYLWPWPAAAATINSLSQPGDRVVIRVRHGAEANPLAYWLDRPIQLADDDAAVERLWHDGRLFGVLSSESFSNLRHRLRPTVLLEFPTGWVLVTNR
jgi:hypothetical protein